MYYHRRNSAWGVPSSLSWEVIWLRESLCGGGRGVEPGGAGVALLVTAGVGFFASGDFVWEKSTPACVVVRQLCGVETSCRLRVSRQLRCERFPKASGKPFCVPAGAYPLPWWGKGRADYGAGSGTCCLMGRSHFFFRWRKKSAQSQRHGDYRKKALIAHFDGGSQCRAQWSWIAITYVWSALVLAFFRRQNGRAFFPPLPIAALLPRRWRWADSNSGAWDASMRLGWLRSTEKRA